MNNITYHIIMIDRTDSHPVLLNIAKRNSYDEAVKYIEALTAQDKVEYVIQKVVREDLIDPVEVNTAIKDIQQESLLDNGDY